MESTHPTLKMEPEELAYAVLPLRETRAQKRTLVLRNEHGREVAFKVKTTEPKMYCVKPNADRIAPNGSIEVEVTLQKDNKYDKTQKDGTAKFLVQTAWFNEAGGTISEQLAAVPNKGEAPPGTWFAKLKAKVSAGGGGSNDGLIENLAEDGGGEENFEAISRSKLQNVSKAVLGQVAFGHAPAAEAAAKAEAVAEPEPAPPVALSATPPAAVKPSLAKPTPSASPKASPKAPAAAASADAGNQQLLADIKRLKREREEADQKYVKLIEENKQLKAQAAAGKQAVATKSEAPGGIAFTYVWIAALLAFVMGYVM